jgi:hypothetical protein
VSVKECHSLVCACMAPWVHGEHGKAKPSHPVFNNKKRAFQLDN